MSETQALPTATTAQASEEVKTLTDANRAIDQDDKAGELTPEQKAAAEQAKPPKTPEQREIERLRRGIDRRTRQLAEARANANLTAAAKGVDSAQADDDSKPLSLTRAQLNEMVKREAEKLAPTLSQQAKEVERRQSVLQTVVKTLGRDKFDAMAEELEEAFDGFSSDGKDTPKPAVEAVFEADDPAKVIAWLSDPENHEEAEKLSRMSAVQAGKAVAKIEAKLMAEQVKTKDRPSKVPPPIEAVKGPGGGSKALRDLSGSDFDKRRKEQIANRGKW